MLQLPAFTVELWIDPLQEAFVWKQQCLIPVISAVRAASTSKHCSLYNKGSFQGMHICLRYVA